MVMFSLHKGSDGSRPANRSPRFSISCAMQQNRSTAERTPRQEILCGAAKILREDTASSFANKAALHGQGGAELANLLTIR
jgi:hypothetical protein